VDHVCHKCGAVVDLGKPFCPQCGAPQIRVAIPEPPLPTAAHHDVPPLPTQIIWRSALPKAAGIALFSVLFMSLAARISMGLGFLSMALIGALTVWLYARSSPVPMSGTMGLKIGIVAGFFAFIAHGGLALTVFVINPEVVMKDVRTAMQQSPAAANPEARQMIERLLSSPEGPTAIMIMALLMLFLLLVGMSALGGSITGAVWRANRAR
jgi:hypothetical protein